MTASELDHSHLVPPRRPPRRRIALAFAAVPLAAVAAALAIGGLEGARDGGAVAPAQERAVLAPASAADATPGAVSGGAAGSVATALPPNRVRAQQYRASLVAHVDDLPALSRATASAMELTRDVGGYLVSATQDSSADGRGYSALVVRVPTRHVQRALVRFAKLGTILDQEIDVRDVQAQLDRLFREAQATRKAIADLERRLAAAQTAHERELLRAQLRAAERRLDELTGRRAVVDRRASFARIALTLTTESTAAFAPPDPGRLERAWERSLDILVGEAIVVLYVVVVAGPFLVLGALAWLAARTRGRRSRATIVEHP